MKERMNGYEYLDTVITFFMLFDHLSIIPGVISLGGFFSARGVVYSLCLGFRMYVRR